MRIFFLIVMSVFLVGCATMQPIVDARGTASGAENSAIEFIKAAKAAKAIEDKPEDETKSSLMLNMLNRGYELITANCDDYFRNSGEIQFRINLSRDITTATATVFTSGMLYNPRNQNAVGVIPLIGGAVYTGMDVYNKNFLFNAENIDAVKTLVMNALATHKAESLEDLGDKNLTYGEVIVMLQENQAYCMPSKIVPLVRSAIKNGEIVKVSSSAPPVEDSRNKDDIAADDAVLKALGTSLNPPSALSMHQATALYWLFKTDTTIKERNAIRETLSGLPTTGQPIDANGVFAAPWAPQQKVEEELAKLSPPTVLKMRGAIAEFREALQRQELGMAEAEGKSAVSLFNASRGLPRLDGTALSSTRGRRPVVVDVK